MKHKPLPFKVPFKVCGGGIGKDVMGYQAKQGRWSRE